MPVCKYLDLSTAHLTESDIAVITDDLNSGADDGKIIGWDREHGFFLHVSAEPDDSELTRDQIKEFKSLGLSDSFFKCYQRARELGCNWIMFDSDADLEEGLDEHV